MPRTPYARMSASILLLLQQTLATAAEPALEEIVVWGDSRDSRQADYTSPTSLLTQEDLASINIATTEDVVKFEPSLVIRRRFIGDSNGTMGMRGANMFQTSRSMVFADGVPLHYLLQSRWNGAPRWTMVSASEIARVEVLYGPFSAEYSGNSMGGVVLIESAIPQQREFHFDSSWFVQDFSAYGFNDKVSGYKSFVSWGDKFDDLSLYASYNRLENESQPQSFYFGAQSSDPEAPSVTGAIAGPDDQGTPRLYFGDTGVIDTITDNYKLKAGLELGRWATLLNIAYEDRSSASRQPNSYIRDTSGATLWSGSVTQDGETFSIPGGRLGVSELERDSLSLGLRIRGDISETISMESNLNRFSVLRDQNRASLSNPAANGYLSDGQVTDYGDTGWQSGEIKFTFSDLGATGLSLISGIRHENYELNIDVYDSGDWEHATFSAYTGRSGGETSITAWFAQFHWTFTDQWNLALGVRAEEFRSSRGYYSDDDPATDGLDLVAVPEVKDSAFSPKFSIAYLPDKSWLFRYSAAKAYRFPIVEELFSQYQAYNAVNYANPDLRPEAGLHHNLMLQHNLSGADVRLNLFQETVKDVIEAQSSILPGGASVRTFIPLDEVRTRGTEFIVNAYGLGLDNLDLRFNLAYTNTEIIKNLADPSIEGNTYPRMPRWRGNLLATYHLGPQWDVGINYQYASDSFGRIDNSDSANEVYGGQDGYSRLGLKTTYRFSSGLGLGIGIDNVGNDIAYVAHPWPGRSMYFNLSYDY